MSTPVVLITGALTGIGRAAAVAFAKKGANVVVAGGRQIDVEPAGAELPGADALLYHKISHNPIAIKRLMVDLFLEAHERPPSEIILDLDATDDPVHGEQEGRFFHGYYDCYCYLPLYVFCGRHLLDAKLRRASVDAADGAVEAVARIVAQIRGRWTQVRTHSSTVDRVALPQ
jgi:NAD(P)-dependent dehydrogenase (short-subunit alcohol dehydrogenase family)